MSIEIIFLSAIKCGQLQLGPHTSIMNQTGDTYASSITLICEDGYKQIDGDAIHTCQFDGQWSGIKLECQGDDTVMYCRSCCMAISVRHEF